MHGGSTPSLWADMMRGPRLRVVVLHGARGGPDTNWFPWLHAELEREGIEVARPRLPTPQGQSLQVWFEAYNSAVEMLDPMPTILVGHSLGAAMALRVLERATASFQGVFLAAGFIGALGLPDYDPINASFFARPFDWPLIRAHKGRACCCWAGDDDPYVPLRRSQELADRLQAPLEVVAGGGHLSDETGVSAFPPVRDAILFARAALSRV